MPSLAALQVAALYPINLLVSPLGPFAGSAIAAFLKLFCAGVFTILYVRRLGVSAAAAAAAGIVYALSGFLIVWLGHPHANAAVLLPLLLYFIEGQLAETGGRRAAIGVAAAFGAMLLGGHPPTAVHVTVAVVLYFAFRISERGRALRLRQTLDVRCGAPGRRRVGGATPVAVPGVLPGELQRNRIGGARPVGEPPDARDTGPVPDAIPGRWAACRIRTPGGSARPRQPRQLQRTHGLRRLVHAVPRRRGAGANPASCGPLSRAARRRCAAGRVRRAALPGADARAARRERHQSPAPVAAGRLQCGGPRRIRTRCAVACRAQRASEPAGDRVFSGHSPRARLRLAEGEHRAGRNRRLVAKLPAWSGGDGRRRARRGVCPLGASPALARRGGDRRRMDRDRLAVVRHRLQPRDPQKRLLPGNERHSRAARRHLALSRARALVRARPEHGSRLWARRRSRQGLHDAEAV